MKKLEIIVRPGMLELLRDELSRHNIHGLNYTEIHGYGRQKGHTEVYRGSALQVDFVPKIKLEIVLHDEQIEEVINTVVATTRTGQVGDGKIFVFDVVDCVRIRTGERGVDAL
ncbi:MAG: P-II family nitrogen regulator [Desulfovibrio sp.]|nr:P-II family nitrogen regulator [Desulfovibrio sp.]